MYSWGFLGTMVVMVKFDRLCKRLSRKRIKDSFWLRFGIVFRYRWTINEPLSWKLKEETRKWYLVNRGKWRNGGEWGNCARKEESSGKKMNRQMYPSIRARFKFFYLIYSRESIPILLKYIISSCSLFFKNDKDLIKFL